MKPPELEPPPTEQIIPKSLDDIIKENRDKFSLRLAISDDLISLSPMVSALDIPKQIRATINEWRIVCLNFPEGKHLILTGINETTQNAYATSGLKSIDFENDLALTTNSIYRLGTKGEGEPGLSILLHICYCFNSWGFGHHLGVLEIFY